eukprot:s1358_g6.t1
MSGKRNTFIGTGRFAAEHWAYSMYSHPAAAPCDRDTSVKYRTPFEITTAPPKEPCAMELKKFPRFELAANHFAQAGACQGWGETLRRRLAEYRVLYGAEPAADWWGWNFFKRS